MFPVNLRVVVYRSGSTLRDGALFMLLSSHTRSMTCKQLSEDPRALANIVNAFARAGNFASFWMHICIWNSQNLGHLHCPNSTSWSFWPRGWPFWETFTLLFKSGVWDEALFRHMSRAARMTDPRAISVNDCAALVGSFAKAQTRAGKTVIFFSL